MFTVLSIFGHLYSVMLTSLLKTVQLGFKWGRGARRGSRRRGPSSNLTATVELTCNRGHRFHSQDHEQG